MSVARDERPYVSPDDTVEMLREHYPGLAPQLLAPFFDVVSFAHGLCTGDLDKFLILLSVALRAFADHNVRRLKPEEIAANVQARPAGRGTNVRSISDSLGIPRETVRRKVAELEKAGLLMREKREMLCTPRAFDLLEEVWQRLAKLATKNYRTIQQLKAGPERIRS